MIYLFREINEQLSYTCNDIIFYDINDSYKVLENSNCKYYRIYKVWFTRKSEIVAEKIPIFLNYNKLKIKKDSSSNDNPRYIVSTTQKTLKPMVYDKTRLPSRSTVNELFINKVVGDINIV